MDPAQRRSGEKAEAIRGWEDAENFYHEDKAKWPETTNIEFLVDELIGASPDYFGTTYISSPWLQAYLKFAVETELRGLENAK